MSPVQAFFASLLVVATALLAGAVAAPYDGGLVELPFPDEWKFVNAIEGDLAKLDDGTEVFVRVMTIPPDTKPVHREREIKEIVDGLEVLFPRPQRIENARVIVPRTTRSLPGDVNYAEMVYGFHNAPGAFCVLWVRRGDVFVLVMATSKSDPRPERLNELRAALIGARWK